MYINLCICIYIYVYINMHMCISMIQKGADKNIRSFRFKFAIQVYSGKTSGLGG